MDLTLQYALCVVSRPVHFLWTCLYLHTPHELSLYLYTSYGHVSIYMRSFKSLPISLDLKHLQCSLLHTDVSLYMNISQRNS